MQAISRDTCSLDSDGHMVWYLQWIAHKIIFIYNTSELRYADVFPYVVRSLHSVQMYHHLPLRLLPRHELVQDGKVLLQALEPLLELSLHLRVVVTQLVVEILPVGGRAHGGAEDGLHDEGVVWLEGVAVGVAERVGEFFGGVGDVVAESLGGEVEATISLH
jgi:hypothetical protein